MLSWWGDVACSCRFHHPPVRHPVPTEAVGTLVPHGKAGVFTLSFYNRVTPIPGEPGEYEFHVEQPHEERLGLEP